MILINLKKLLKWNARKNVLKDWHWEKYFVEELDGVIYNWFEYWKGDYESEEYLETGDVQCYTHLKGEKVTDEEMMEFILEWFEQEQND